MASPLSEQKDLYVIPETVFNTLESFKRIKNLIHFELNEISVGTNSKILGSRENISVIQDILYSGNYRKKEQLALNQIIINIYSVTNKYNFILPNICHCSGDTLLFTNENGVYNLERKKLLHLESNGEMHPAVLFLSCRMSQLSRYHFSRYNNKSDILNVVLKSVGDCNDDRLRDYGFSKITNLANALLRLQWKDDGFVDRSIQKYTHMIARAHDVQSSSITVFRVLPITVDKYEITEFWKRILNIGDDEKKSLSKLGIIISENRIILEVDHL
jgi:hypothetical protein